MLKKILLLSVISQTTFAGVLVKEVISENKSLVQEVSYTKKNVTGPLVIRDLPLYLGEQDFTSSEIYRETIYPDSNQKVLHLPTINNKDVEFAGSEVRTIIKQGPDSNRIVLTIIGDGYTEAEREKFFEDTQFIVDDLFKGVTFKSYLSFFNIYAVFTPSKESGITDTVKRNTVFGLYRSPANSKRAILPGNTTAIERALKLAPAAAHYPIIIANDDYYGGLGGRYAISTRARISGPVVLRHELGHNFSNVGEEYDGGSVYSGANFSTTGSDWNHWKNGNHNEKHEAKFLFGAYIWKPLTKPFIQDFTADKNSSLFTVEISSVGWEKEGDVEILLDGSPLSLSGDYTKDRSFFETEPFELRPGKHQLVIRSNGNNPNHILAFANGYGFPESYDFSSGEVKAFNNFNENEDMVGYRPTENICLMRNMLSKIFCAVDQENIWLQFLMRVSLIDSLTINASGFAELKTIPLSSSDLEIKWFDGEKELPELQGQNAVPAKAGLKARVRLTTKEVRKKSSHFEDERSL